MLTKHIGRSSGIEIIEGIDASSCIDSIGIWYANRAYPYYSTADNVILFIYPSLSNSSLQDDNDGRTAKTF